MSKEEQFVKDCYAAAVAAGKRYNLNPVAILAQGAHEGAWGTSYGATARKNHFGITATGAANEFWDGSKSQSSVSKLWFRIYKTQEAGFNDFGRLISSKYPTCAARSADIAGYAKCIANSVYISETNGDNRPAYERAIIAHAGKISTLITQFGLDKPAGRRIDHIVLHCTATDQQATPAAIQKYWRETLGWKNPGYHIMIPANGASVRLLADEKVSNGVAGHNANSLHVSYIGGIDAKGNPVDNRTNAQRTEMIRIVRRWLEAHPTAQVLGHRDFQGVTKACPSFDARRWWASVV